jgi:hypothetical protein
MRRRLSRNKWAKIFAMICILTSSCFSLQGSEASCVIVTRVQRQIWVAADSREGSESDAKPVRTGLARKIIEVDDHSVFTLVGVGSEEGGSFDAFTTAQNCSNLKLNEKAKKFAADIIIPLQAALTQKRKIDPETFKKLYENCNVITAVFAAFDGEPDLAIVQIFCNISNDGAVTLKSSFPPIAKDFFAVLTLGVHEAAQSSMNTKFEVDEKQVRSQLAYALKCQSTATSKYVAPPFDIVMIDAEGIHWK